ncbi:MAG: 5-oxoprolinase subunit B family protein [Roseinatronobacter sp.]
MHDGQEPGVAPLGVDGMLVSFGAQLTEAANRAALAFGAAVDRADLPGLAEVSVALTSVHLRYDVLRVDPAQMTEALRALLAERDWTQAALAQGRRLWRVPTVFGSDLAPQLDDAAALAGLDREAAIASLCAAPLRVQTIGFAPGQPYLGQLPPAWDIPRQTGLTAQVPMGALAVAIRQLVLFSVSTPTGWRHLGQTALRLFRPDAPEPFLLRPGDEVLFDPVSRDAYARLCAAPDGGAQCSRIPA